MKRAMLIAAAALMVSASSVASSEEASFSRKGADSCLACHDDATTLAVFKTPHGVPGDTASPFGHGQLQCESCHGPGGEHAARLRRGQERPAIPVFGANSPASLATRNAMCLECHDGDVGLGWHTGAHAAGEAACSDCHSSHTASDPVLQVATQQDVCDDCHQLQRNQMSKAFTHPVFDGKMTCSGCHSLHGDNAATELARQTLNATCEECHAEKRGPFLWEHAPVSEDCGLCHAPHGSNHAGMLVKRAPLLCQSCHAPSGHPSIAYGTEGLAGNMPSQFLLAQSCMNCHSQVHGSNHPSGSLLAR